MFRHNPIKKQLKSLKLETDVKQEIRDRLMLEMKTTERFERNTTDERLLTQKQIFKLFSSLTFYRKIPMPIFALLLALTLGTGTTLAAENSLPGEILYPMKIGVNEEVREIFAFNPEQKANWELERANRRAEEMMTIQSKGNMIESIRERLENSMIKNEKKIAELTKKLEENGDPEYAAMIQARLHQYLEIKTNILEGIKTYQEDMQSNNLTEEEKARRHAELLKQQEEYKNALDRRHLKIKQQQDKHDDLMERRRQILEQNQNEQEAMVERRHEIIQIQQEEKAAMIERRHTILSKIQDSLNARRDTQTENTN